jgi:hypothetical protein
VVRGKYKFYSHRWIGSHFAITLLVKAGTKRSKLSLAFFDEMPQIDRNDKFAEWLKRKTMKLWEIISFYTLFADNVSVEYLIIEARCLFVSVKLSDIEQTVQRTLEELWYNLNKNERIPFKVSMNDDKCNIVRNMVPSEQNNTNVSVEKLESKEKFLYIYSLETDTDTSNTDNSRKELFKISDSLWTPLIGGTLITNVFFCQQVDLLSEANVHTLSHGLELFLCSY